MRTISSYVYRENHRVKEKSRLGTEYSFISSAIIGVALCSLFGVTPVLADSKELKRGTATSVNQCVNDPQCTVKKKSAQQGSRTVTLDNSKATRSKVIAPIGGNTQKTTLKREHTTLNNQHNTVVVNRHQPSKRYERRRVYHGVVIYRPYGYPYPGYGMYYNDNDAFKWLAFTAIMLKSLDLINESQQRAHEQAQIQATTAPLNQPIVWSDGSTSGSVVATREGSSGGHYCREFQQTITVNGKKEQAYGNACQQPDGSWKIVAN